MNFRRFFWMTLHVGSMAGAPRSVVQPVSAYDVWASSHRRLQSQFSRTLSDSCMLYWVLCCVVLAGPGLLYVDLSCGREESMIIIRFRWLRRANSLLAEARSMWPGQAVGRSWRYRQINEINGNETLYHNLENVLGAYHVLCTNQNAESDIWMIWSVEKLTDWIYCG